jgi:hypothetical protein
MPQARLPGVAHIAPYDAWALSFATNAILFELEASTSRANPAGAATGPRILSRVKGENGKSPHCRRSDGLSGLDVRVLKPHTRVMIRTGMRNGRPGHSRRTLPVFSS